MPVHLCTAVEHVSRLRYPLKYKRPAREHIRTAIGMALNDHSRITAATRRGDSIIMHKSMMFKSSFDLVSA